MIQSALYFLMGFVAAAFLALLVAPSIWRRAVFLTRKRIESSVPLTVNELEADKDRLRAEHAMAQRRLEIRGRETHDQLVSQSTRAGQLDAEVKKQAAMLEHRDETITDLEKRNSELDVTASERGSEIAALNLQLETVRAELEIRSGELDSANRFISEADKRFDTMRRRFEAANEDLVKTRGETARQRDLRRETQAKTREANIEAKQSVEQLLAERARNEALNKKLETAVRKHSELEQRVTRREKEILRLQASHQGDTSALGELESRAVDAERQAASLETELAAITLAHNQLNKLIEEKGYDAQVEALEAQLGKAHADIEKLEAQLTDLQDVREAASNQASATADDDAALREQINSLAAELVDITAVVEGEGSKIHAILAEDDMPSVGEHPSLADRIRQLRQRARKAAE